MTLTIINVIDNFAEFSIKMKPLLLLVDSHPRQFPRIKKISQ